MSRPLRLALFLLGAAIFGYLVAQIGVGQLVSDAGRTGFMFVPILLVYALVYACSALAWRLTMGDSLRPSFWRTFAVTISAGALNFLTPVVNAGGEAFRVGGEEFTILFPNKTVKDVMDYLELLRLNIESATFRVRSGEERRKISRAPDRRAVGGRRTALRVAPASLLLSVTVSIGLAESQPSVRIAEVIQQADKALYRAKQGGRNRIEAAIQRKTVRERKPKKPARL